VVEAAISEKTVSQKLADVNAATSPNAACVGDCNRPSQGRSTTRNAVPPAASGSNSAVFLGKEPEKVHEGLMVPEPQAEGSWSKSNNPTTPLRQAVEDGVVEEMPIAASPLEGATAASSPDSATLPKSDPAAMATALPINEMNAADSLPQSQAGIQRMKVLLQLRSQAPLGIEQSFQALNTGAPQATSGQDPAAQNLMVQAVQAMMALPTDLPLLPNVEQLLFNASRFFPTSVPFAPNNDEVLANMAASPVPLLPLGSQGSPMPTTSLIPQPLDVLGLTASPVSLATLQGPATILKLALIASHQVDYLNGTEPSVSGPQPARLSSQHQSPHFSFAAETGVVLCCDDLQEAFNQEHGLIQVLGFKNNLMGYTSAFPGRTCKLCVVYCKRPSLNLGLVETRAG
jgi:hypothetical protein